MIIKLCINTNRKIIKFKRKKKYKVPPIIKIIIWTTLNKLMLNFNSNLVSNKIFNSNLGSNKIIKIIKIKTDKDKKTKIIKTIIIKSRIQ